MHDLLKFIKPTGGTVVEVGSRDGNDADLMAKKLKADRVIVIEANEDCATDIQAKYPKFEVHNVAITNKTGTVDFWKVRPDYGQVILGQSSILYKNSYSEIADKISVPALTMDDFVAAKDVDIIDVLKVDVEGATYEFLEGFSNIRISKLVHLETEYVEFWEGQKTHWQISEKMINNGYELIFTKPVWTDQADSIWRRNG